MAIDILATARKLGIDPEKIGFGPKTHILPGPEQAIPADDPIYDSLSRVLFGPIGALGDYYFPTELIGGCCPRLVGEEEEIVWNAAAEAADSERVHVVWQAKGDKIWYLAVRSAELASHPNTWCPFASLLPGMKDATPVPACYTFYSDEAATMMTITADGLQIHRSTTSVVRAKAERTARELNDAPIIELVPDVLDKLTPMPWYSLSLFEDRARRILAVFAVLSALGCAALGVLILLIATITMTAAHINMNEVKARTAQKSMSLMQAVQNLHASPMQDQLSRFADVNDGLLNINGLLEVYQIKDSKTLWRAVIPASVTANVISKMGAQMLDNNANGVVIGNNHDALALGTKR